MLGGFLHRSIARGSKTNYIGSSDPPAYGTAQVQRHTHAGKHLLTLVWLLTREAWQANKHLLCLIYKCGEYLQAKHVPRPFN